jgi:hypothetical protein
VFTIVSLPSSEPRESESERKVFTTRVLVYLTLVQWVNATYNGKFQNTFVCAFDQQSPRISAYNIHEWIHNTLCLRESETVMIEIDGPQATCVHKI